MSQKKNSSRCLILVDRFRDLDGLGDRCDGDLDGDGFDNARDACPDLANPGQEDADGDGLGDDCDTDRDGDLVEDADDNCTGPEAYNPGQEDTDADSQGDACDVDDDGDGVVDPADGCPLVANGDQADADRDGIQDGCDADDDGDGIDDALDRCPGTPGGTVVDDDGCNGSQLVERIAGRRSDYANHGTYVSAVVEAVHLAVRAGLLSSREGARLSSLAARGN